MSFYRIILFLVLCSPFALGAAAAEDTSSHKPVYVKVPDRIVKAMGETILKALDGVTVCIRVEHPHTRESLLTQVTLKRGGTYEITSKTESIRSMGMRILKRNMILMIPGMFLPETSTGTGIRLEEKQRALSEMSFFGVPCYPGDLCFQAYLVFDELSQTVTFINASVQEERETFASLDGNSIESFSVRHTGFPAIIFRFDRAHTRELMRLRALMLSERAEAIVSDSVRPVEAWVCGVAPLWVFIRIAELLDDRRVCPHAVCEDYEDGEAHCHHRVDD